MMNVCMLQHNPSDGYFALAEVERRWTTNSPFFAYLYVPRQIYRLPRKVYETSDTCPGSDRKSGTLRRMGVRGRGSIVYQFHVIKQTTSTQIRVDPFLTARSTVGSGKRKEALSRYTTIRGKVFKCNVAGIKVGKANETNIHPCTGFSASQINANSLCNSNNHVGRLILVCTQIYARPHGSRCKKYLLDN